MRRRPLRIGTGIGAFAALVLLAEWASGWGLPGTLPPERRLVNRVHPTRGWMPLAGQEKTIWNGKRVAMNELGYREGALGPKRPGEFRVWFIGDSVTMGLEVEEEETFVRRLERALRAADPDLRAVNAGVYGYAVHQERELLAEDWDAVDPNGVVLVFCLNDVVGVLPQRRGEIPGWLAGPADFFARTNMFRRACWIAERRHRSAARRASVEAGGAARLLNDEIEEMLWAGLWVRGGAAAQEDWTATARDVAACAALARGRSVPFLCVIAPVRLQFRAGLFDDPDDSHRPGAVRAPQKRLMDNPGLAEVAFLDLFDAFAASGGERLFLDHTHFSAEGHAVAARTIAEGIRGWTGR